MIYRNAGNINKDRPNHEIATITPYVVTPSWDRYNYIEGMAAKFRQDPSNPMAKNVRMGRHDFELRTQYHRTNRKFDINSIEEWAHIRPMKIPSCAPPIDLSYQPRNKAPGRNILPTPPPTPTPRTQEAPKCAIHQAPTSQGHSSKETQEQQEYSIFNMPTRPQTTLGLFSADCMNATSSKPTSSNPQDPASC